MAGRKKDQPNEQFYEDKHTIRDGRVLFFRRRGNARKVWQCRVKLVGKTGYVTRSTKTSNYEEAVEFAGDLFDELRQRVRDKRPLKSLAFYDVYQKWLGILHITKERRYYHEKTGSRYLRQFFGK